MYINIIAYDCINRIYQNDWKYMKIQDYTLYIILINKTAKTKTLMEETKYILNIKKIKQQSFEKKE